MLSLDEAKTVVELLMEQNREEDQKEIFKLREELAAKDELIEQLRQKIIELEQPLIESDFTDPPEEDLTCFECKAENCPFRGDPYNTQGDCLAEK